MHVCSTDKVRFCDPEATSNAHLIHTIEVSDARSVKQFVSLWFKGKGGRFSEYRDAKGLDDHHQRDIYHRCGPWLPAQYPGKESEGWSNHAHVDLDRPPQIADLEPFRDEIPATLLSEIAQYLDGPPPDHRADDGCCPGG